MLDTLGRVYDKGLEMVDQDLLMAVKKSVSLIVKNELLINHEMFL